MSLRLDHDEAEAISPAERRDEVASVLARGVLRLHGRLFAHFDHPQNLGDDAPTCLDLPSASRPDRPTG